MASSLIALQINAISKSMTSCNAFMFDHLKHFKLEPLLIAIHVFMQSIL